MMVIETFSNKIIIITIIYYSFLAVCWKTRSKFWMASEKNEKANWHLMTLELTHVKNVIVNLDFQSLRVVSYGCNRYIYDQWSELKKKKVQRIWKTCNSKQKSILNTSFWEKIINWKFYSKHQKNEMAIFYWVWQIFPVGRDVTIFPVRNSHINRRALILFATSIKLL